MRLIHVYHNDLLNGEGLREVLFFSGCDFSCSGCFNKELQNVNYQGSKFSHEWSNSDYQALSERLNKSYISGVTISGGDGFSKYNKKDTLNLCKKLKSDFPNKTIWLYTGWTFENIINCKDEKTECLQFIDVLVDGKFDKNLKSPELPWVGSSNQRVIDVQKSLNNNSIVLYDTKH